jgi:hypothetical protein
MVQRSASLENYVAFRNQKKEKGDPGQVGTDMKEFAYELSFPEKTADDKA